MTQRVLTFHYTLTDNSGQKLDSSEGRGPLAFIEGKSQIIPGLEKEIIALNKGDKRKIEVTAANAYGERMDNLVIKVPKASLPNSEIKIGDRFSAGGGPASGGRGSLPVFTVTAIRETEVTLDGNHPLAGTDLVFDIEMTDIREATAEELQHGHVHGEHGHAH